MSPYTRPAYLLLQVLAFLEVLVFAKPIPLPLPLMMVDYSPSFISVNRSIPSFVRRVVGPPTTMTDSPHARQVGSLSNLNEYLDAAGGNANNLSDLAAKSPNVDENDLDFQQDCVAELTGFAKNMQGFQTAFVESSAAHSDNGLANYDNTNAVETLLKQFVNLNKKTLSSTDVLVYNIPVLGRTLGPIVYDIKCLVENILDAVEDLTDYIVNTLQPLLQSLLGKMVSTTCRPGVELAGVCI